MLAGSYTKFKAVIRRMRAGTLLLVEYFLSTTQSFQNFSLTTRTVVHKYKSTATYLVENKH